MEYKPNPRLARVLDILFILHAEDEMNCSTAAARHLASSGVDVYTAIVGAVGALYGPFHGRANEPIQGPVVPKFGEWQDNHCASTGVDSYIFNKVKEETNCGVGGEGVPTGLSDSPYTNGHMRDGYNNSKKEKENIHMKIIELEKALDARQSLTLDIRDRKIKRAEQVMKHMKNNGDIDSEGKLEEIQDSLKEKKKTLYFVPKDYCLCLCSSES